MKTIEQAAKESLLKHRVPNTEPELNIVRSVWYRSGFNDAIKFAQQCISVEEELPEMNTPVIVKTIQHKYRIGLLNKFDWVDPPSNTYIPSFDKVTHWRPIELK